MHLPWLFGEWRVVTGKLGEMAQALVLASQSPRRKELLGILGMPFTIVTPNVDETPHPGERPQEYVVRVARLKALDVASRLKESVIVSADTVVTIDGELALCS